MIATLSLSVIFARINALTAWSRTTTPAVMANSRRLDVGT
jgi:hypothetical protein